MTLARAKVPCWQNSCVRPAVVTIPDGRSYCKHHGDRLPRYLLRKAKATP